MGWALSQLLQIKLQRRARTRAHAHIFPAELKLSRRNVFAVTFQECGSEQITHLHPQSRGANICVWERRCFLFMGFYLPQLLQFLLFATSDYDSLSTWSLILLNAKSYCYKFPFILSILSCYWFSTTISKAPIPLQTTQTAQSQRLFGVLTGLWKSPVLL